MKKDVYTSPQIDLVFRIRPLSPICGSFGVYAESYSDSEEDISALN